MMKGILDLIALCHRRRCTTYEDALPANPPVLDCGSTASSVHSPASRFPTLPIAPPVLVRGSRSVGRGRVRVVSGTRHIHRRTCVHVHVRYQPGVHIHNTGRGGDTDGLTHRQPHAILNADADKHAPSDHHPKPDVQPYAHRHTQPGTNAHLHRHPHPHTAAHAGRHGAYGARPNPDVPLYLGPAR